MDNDEQFGRPRLKRKPLNVAPGVEPEGQAIAPIQQNTLPPEKTTAGQQTTEVPQTPQPPPGDRQPQAHDRMPRREQKPRQHPRDRRPPRPQDQQRAESRPRPTERTPKPERVEKQARPPARIEPVKLSVIIPAYNEEGNIAPLLEQFKILFASLPYRAEVVIVDDGSTDRTGIRIREGQMQYPWLKLFTHRRNFGLTTALETAIGKATGRIICFYPADLQYHASEIPKLVAKIDAGADVATGWKQGNYGLKSIGSSIYNLLSRMLFRVKVHDLNSIKAFTREVAETFIYRHGWHRYMVVMAVGEGFKVDEVKVKLYPRRSGKSKFNFWWRLPSGFLDLISVKFQLSFTTKPLLFFGSAGLISGFLGFLVGLVAIYFRVIKHEGFRPLLYLVILLIVSGLMLFFGGFLAELVVSVREDVKRRKTNNLI